MASHAQSSLLTGRGPKMGGFVVVSVGLHVAVIAVGVLLGTVDRGPRKIDLGQKPIKATLVRLGKEREQKLLPRKEELPAPPREVKAAPRPPDPVPAPTPVATPVPSPLARPAPAPAPSPGAKTQEPQKRSLFDAINKASARPEELEGAADGDVFGDSPVQEGERYFGAVTSQVRRYYDVSQTIAEQDRLHLHAVVSFRIDRGGALIGDPSLKQSSGNALFDSAVLSAVKRAAPFGPPPDHLRGELQSKGFETGFRP